MESGIECALSKFVNDTKEWGEVNTLERRDDIQRDLDRVERRACVNLMNSNKAECKVLYMGLGHPKHRHKLGRVWTESCPEERDLGALVDEKFDMTRQCVLAAQKASCVLQKKQHGQQVQRVEIVQPGEGATPGRFYRSLPVPERAYEKDGEDILPDHVVTGHYNSFKLKESMLRSYLKIKFFTVRRMRNWNRLSGEVVAALSLAIFRAGLDGALSNLV
ncbi:rna-directed dna polymerase from mobile element jockey-like [Pitangus sulphuratus]|nr:rna-directed dna polymerase from mobile element jockey-like [Pitangus sulphuratus]